MKTGLLSEEERALLVPQLVAIRAKYAPRALELALAAKNALRELELLEDRMDDEALALCPKYQRALPQFQLTFETHYRELAEENDTELHFLAECVETVEGIEREAAATVAAVAAGGVEVRSL
jgi:hypothetical protein